MMSTMRRGSKNILWIILAFFLLLPVAALAAEKDDCKNEICEDVDGVSIVNQKTHTVMIGKAMILRINKDISKFEIPEKDIVKAEILSPKKIYLIGENPGIAHIKLFKNEDTYPFTIYRVEVKSDVVPLVVSLKDDLHKIFPNEKNIQVLNSGNSIILSGTVSNAATLSKMLTLAESYSGKDKKLINLLEVGGVQQVMLEVRISEMSKSLGRKLGINFNAIGRMGADGTIRFLSLLDAPAALSSQLYGQYIRGDVTWTTLIDAMKQRGLIKVLAEPTLITMTGKQANFLAGGEYPYPVIDNDGKANVNFKNYGVGLNFTPTVLGNGRISMAVAPEVSELDFTNAMYISGYFVPALQTRRVSTTVELADGQSFAVAGLLRDDVREAIRKVPLLGDIPILGNLFKSSEFQKNETELVIIVTPHLVKPLDLAKQTLPTDQFVEPNDLEFYVLGLDEGLIGGRSNTGISSSQPSVSGGGGLDGDFGHIVP